MNRPAEPSHSVSEWIAELKFGDHEAGQRIWNRYVSKLTSYARQKLQFCRRRMEDENDAVQLAFKDFLEIVQEEKYHKLDDRHDLWQLLLTYTSRRAIDIMRRENRINSGGQDLVDINISSNETDRDWFFNLSRDEPSPEFATIFWDYLEQAIGVLPDDDLRQIVWMKLGGRSNREIGEMIGRTSRTVERKLEKIRDIWSSKFPHDFYQ